MRHCYASHFTESKVKCRCPNCEQVWRVFKAIGRHDRLSLTLSTVTFFVSSYFIKRYLEDAGIATGMTRGVLIFSIALMMSYGVAWVADFLTK